MNSKQKRAHRRQILRTWGEQVADAIALAKLRGQEHVIFKGRYFSLRVGDPIYDIAKNLDKEARYDRLETLGGSHTGRIVFDESTDFDQVKAFVLGKALQTSRTIAQARREDSHGVRLLGPGYWKNIRRNQGLSQTHPAKESP